MKQRYLKDPSSLGMQFLGTFLAAATFTFLFIAAIGCNAVQMASFVLVRPWSPKLFWQINRTFAGGWWTLCVLIAQKGYGLRFVYTGDSVPPEENAVVIANHQQMADVLGVLAFAREKRRIGDMKYFVKAALRVVPGLGWGMVFLDFLFLSRNWDADATLIQKVFSRLKNSTFPLWIISFSEGTRITPVKSEASRKYAESVGLSPTDYVMVPRTKGFVATISAMRSRVDAVYDVTIAYPEGVPTTTQLLKGYVSEIHLHVRRHSIQSLPEDPGALSAWLLDRFQEKDRWLKQYYENRLVQ